ncbi:MAG: Gfo/Idh/MocA family oxidoreductase [Ilumatobacteraceae bacterium]
MSSDCWNDAQLVTGSLDPGRVAELERFVRAGGAVLVAAEPDDPCGEAFTGVGVVADLPCTEWFVTLADSPAAARLDGETAVTSQLRTLRASGANDAELEIAATTSIRFEHQATIAVRQLGAGRIVVTGIADLRALAAHPTLGPFVNRLLHPVAPVHTSDLGVGVVGYGPFGGMGYLHGLAATETDGLALVAAADSAPERLVAARADFPELAGHASAASLAADPAVDIAIIATPPVFHAELALELLHAGKHVVIEKPMCLRRDDADAIIATARDHERTVTVHQSRRWDRDWLAVRNVTGRGEIGDVFNIETFVGGFEHPCRAWHSEESISGGAIYDWGSHHIDWIIQLYGSAPSRVLCSAHTRVWHDTTNADQLSLWMQWADGREATFRQSDVCAIRRPKFHIEGTRGTIEGHYRPLRTDAIEPGRGHVEHVSHHAEAPVDLTVATYDGTMGVRESTVPPAPAPGWGFHRNLADHLLLGEPLAVRPEQSRDVVAVLEAGHRSGANGGELIELG